MVFCTILLTFSSIRFITRVVDASISRRTLILEEARGTIIVLIHVTSKCIMVNAGRKLDR